MAAILDFNSLGYNSKLYTDIQYEIILSLQLQKPFIKKHNQPK